MAKAQSLEITGVVKSSADVENIHVINKTAHKFTITNTLGGFVIPVNLNDTLSFSSVQHQLKSIVVSKEIMRSKSIRVVLIEKINTLKQVTLGKVLSGDLNADISDIDEEAPVNFYNVGIPGYKGKLATQSERRLNEATTGGGIPLNPIINAITGRTKMLKKRVAHERNDVLITKIKEEFSESLFSIYKLDEEFRMDFFYFCEMDENFYKKCNGTPDLDIFEFLKQKLKQYKTNQQEED
ncbi:hypothetical protein ACKGJY_12255 [Hyunsoonleella sp. 2307UL5-6]|uniref:hypothetical protein n=1 Tax=Hyunsoonleella sp. 2307UL5-6 TaxID=3384768 RepID=UPI0039BC6A60